MSRYNEREEWRGTYEAMLCKNGRPSMEGYAWFRALPELQKQYNVEDIIISIQHEQTPVKVICLCGSSKFRYLMHRVALDETLAGNVILQPEFFNQKEAKQLVDSSRFLLVDLHFRKIEMADEILVVNPQGYIGENTAAEITHAEAHGKTVRYLVEPVRPFKLKSYLMRKKRK